jgi:hypothetical protein
MNMASCRTLGSTPYLRSTSNSNKKNKMQQMAIADLFYAWGEVIATDLEALNDNENLIQDKNECSRYFSVESFITEGNIIFFFIKVFLFNRRN